MGLSVLTGAVLAAIFVVGLGDLEQGSGLNLFEDSWEVVGLHLPLLGVCPLFPTVLSISPNPYLLCWVRGLGCSGLGISLSELGNMIQFVWVRKLTTE